MSLHLVTSPVEWPIHERLVQEHLRLGHQPVDDALLEEYIDAAVARLDGPTGLLGRALITQTWRYLLPCFPSTIVLPLPPCQTVDSIKYIDTDGLEQTLDVASYRTFNIHATVDTTMRDDLEATYGTSYQTGPAKIKTAVDKTWPATQQDNPEAVTVEFTAGYGPTLTTIPQPLQHALAMDVAHLYENRETLLIGQAVTEVPMGYMSLIAPYKEWGF